MNNTGPKKEKVVYVESCENTEFVMFSADVNDAVLRYLPECIDKN